MRKNSLYRVVLIIVAVSIMLAGCGGAALSTAGPEPGKEPNKEIPALNITCQVHNEMLRDDEGTDLLYLKILSPKIDNADNQPGITAIMDYYGVKLDHFVTSVLSEGRQNALEEMKAAEELNYEFHPFAYERSFDICYNANNLLSITNLQYENTGGAHPNYFQEAATFDVSTGKKLTLADIMGVSREKALEKVYETVLAQIEETKSSPDFAYFDSYKEDVKEYYAEDDFILSSDSIVFFYQRGTIAAGAAGIVSFELPYDKAGELAISIPTSESKELENELITYAARLIDANNEVFTGIFGLSMLVLDIPESMPENEWVYPVKDDRFATYADLDSFIRNIYVESEADSLMGNGRYINKDGKLYGDMSKDAGMGYYVDWNNYSFKISEISPESALLTINTTDNSPAGTQDITINVKMIKAQNGWLLEKMFS